MIFDRLKMLSNGCRYFRIASTIAYASFSTDECFCSAEVRVLEKKATGRQFWVREATIACSEASVSISKGREESIATRDDFAISCFRHLKASVCSLVRG